MISDLILCYKVRKLFVIIITQKEEIRSQIYRKTRFILSIEKIEKNLFIDFITGSDYKNFTNNNIEIINNIKKISFDDLNSSEKIRKIISLIQKSRYK